MKFPSIPHLPTSNNIDEDDDIIETLAYLKTGPVGYLEKLDGEICCMTRESIHARSDTSPYTAPWQKPVKTYWQTFRYDIPENTYIFAENLYPQKTIGYPELDSPLYVFASLDIEKDLFHHLSTTDDIARDIGLPTVPMILIGDFSISFECPETSSFGDEIEGYVVRSLEPFYVKDADKAMAKFVREDYKIPDEDWVENWKEGIEPNEFLSEE